MIFRAPLKWLAATSAAALTALAAGQAPQTQPPADLGPPLPPRYEVELIVFANRNFDASEERFDHTLQGFGTESLVPLAMPPVVDDTTLLQLQPEAAPRLVEVPPLVDTPPPDPAAVALLEALRIRPLGPEELKLGNEYRKLAAIPAYTPLLHAGWVQPGLPEGEAPSFDLARLGVWNPRGTVRVHLSRFLHITLDLTYQAATSSSPGESSPEAGLPPDVGSPSEVGSPLVVGDGLYELTLGPRYRLTATRSSRSGELHYFDHPAFGVLVRITPVPTPGTGPSSRRPAA